MTHPANVLTLVADIGGTNTRCALARGWEVLEGTVRRYGNAEHPDIASVLRAYVADEGGVDPAACCVAAAGPVRDEAVTMTNIAHWPTITKDVLAEAARAETVAILNDLQAQGHAIGHVAPDRLRTILPFPEANANAAKLVIGVGTGFNSVPVFDAEGGRLVPPSESGHVNLPIREAADLRLSEWLGRLPPPHGFPSVEEALSGRGIEHIYAWLADEDGSDARPSAAAIMGAVADGSDPRALRTARVASRLLGTVAGNLALLSLPFGGVWLIGGVARALAPLLAQNGFVEAFRDKGRFRPLMERFGVGVVEDDNAALTGCASHLVGLLGRGA